MQKVLSVVTALILSVLTISFLVCATNGADVGRIEDTSNVINGINYDDMNYVRMFIQKEYNRGIQTRSVKHKGSKYFSYGKSTDEYVHALVGAMQKDKNGNYFRNSCMVQNFTGGYSDSLAALGQGANWCCILVTIDSLRKGEAYTVRDGIAAAWGNAGGVNSEWGMPTDNQRWVYGDYDAGPGMYCYQTFDWGYAMGLNGSVAFVKFYRYDEGNVPPTGGEYDYDWGISDLPISEESAIVIDDFMCYYPPIPIDPISDLNTSSTESSDESKSEVLPGILSDEQEDSSVSEVSVLSPSEVPMGIDVSNTVGEAMHIADTPEFSGVKITLMIVGAVIIIGVIAATIVFSEHLILKKQENLVIGTEEQNDSEE